MKKVILLSSCVICLWPVVFSQDVRQNVIAADGGIAQGSNISLEWTLGEMSVESIISGKHLYTQGFHQPILIAKSSNDPGTPLQDRILSGYKVLLTPNPAQTFATVYISADVPEKFTMYLYDIGGKLISTRLASGTDLSVRIEMSSLTSGIYLMDVRNSQGQSLKAFKVVKAE